jgi:hypothetical protein
MKKRIEHLFENHPEALLALIYLVVLAAACMFTTVGFSQSEAKYLWKIIEQKSGVQKELTFVPFDAEPGSYNISGSTIYYSDASNNPGSVYAVAALSGALHVAVMTKPDISGIHLLKPGKWQDLSLSYTPKYVVNNYVNIPNSGWERTWMWWHHIPTLGTGGANFNRSWWLGMCLKYPQLAPPTGPIGFNTKPNILHKDFPKIVYDEWVLRGKPEYCSLFEIDGSGFWWATDLFPIPKELNETDKQAFRGCISIGRINYWYNRQSPYFKANIRKWLPVVDSIRVNLNDFYVQAYKNIEAYFNEQGATSVRFNILGYSAYRVPSATVMATDLSRFDLYYTSPLPATWTQSEMMKDRQVWNHWKATGARMIWRPNLWFTDRFYPHLNFQKHCAFVRLVQPDGLLITGYTPAAIPLIQGLNYYTMFRQSQGVNFQQSVQEYLATMPDYYGDYYRQAMKLTETRSWSDSALMTLPESVDREASLQWNRYQRGELTYDQLVQWWEDVLVMFPGSGTIRRVQSAIGERPAPED